jgi:hypothetical protein
MLPETALIPLLLFTALFHLVSLHLLAASGQFPREYRSPALASAYGALVLYGTMTVALASMLTAVFAAWKMIPWYAAVIGGGLAVLAAPVVLQRFSDRFVDGRAALVGFAAASALIALLLIWLAGRHHA